MLGGNSDTHAWNIARGFQNTNSPYCNYWDGGRGGQNLFVALRDCNIFLENIHKAVDLNEKERELWIAEVKFLKAFYHFFLLRSYGPIPIIDKNIPVSGNIDEVRVYREPVEKVAEYIVSLLDEVAEELPSYIVLETKDMGRATKPMALALKAKTLTLIASPMFNGNPYYQDMKDNRGIHLFPTTEDPAKWQAAALAIEEAIESAHEAGHGLYYYDRHDPLSDETKAKLNIRGSVTERWNKEIIWGSSRSSNHLQRLSVIGFGTGHIEENILTTMSVTLDVAERYYSKNGVPIEECKDFDYNNRYQTGIVGADNRFLMLQGYETANLHFNREPRFYASLFFDGSAIYMYSGTASTDNPSTMHYSRMKRGQHGGLGGGNNGYSITGYIPQKFLNVQTYTIDAYPSLRVYRYAFPYIRLADLYLMYAEALNEIKTAPDNEVCFWINEVRTRASLKGVHESWTQHSSRPDKVNTQVGMREIIRRERLIELSLEGEAYWDLLRWKEAENVMNRPIRGWTVTEENTGDYYNVRVIETPRFGVRDYLMPISQGSMDRNNNLIQNPMW